MGNGFMKETKGIVDEALNILEKAPPPAQWDGVSLPQYFFTISMKSRLFINVPLVERPAISLDDVLSALYDFLDENPRLDQGNIYLTRLGPNSILLEPHGTCLFAEIFDGPVEKPHYKGFHGIVKHLRRSYPTLGEWDGKAEKLPNNYTANTRTYILTGKDASSPEKVAPHPAATVPEPEPVEEDATLDMDVYEKKMKDWYSRGYNIEPVKEALHEEKSSLVRAFSRFEKDIVRLDELGKAVDDLEFEGFDEDVRALRAMLKDTRRIAELENGIDSLRAGIMDRYRVKLPVHDQKLLAAAIKRLPLGIPSSLWGIALDHLVDQIVEGEKGLTPGEQVVVKLRKKWYLADAGSPDFLTAAGEAVRTQREIMADKHKSKTTDVDSILNKIFEL